MAAKRICGIDLGTTYSCIAYVDDAGKAVVVPNFDNDLTTPSVVHFESDGNVVVGKTAKNSAEIEPERVASLVKRSPFALTTASPSSLTMSLPHTGQTVGST